MPVTLEQNDDSNLIRLEGAVDISCAAELKMLMLQALKSEKEVRISLEHVTDLDVTAIQLLWAVGREARVSGVDLTLTGPVPDELSYAIADAGLESLSIPVSTR
jgi:ABC-type transporter Mla MlaB component